MAKTYRRFIRINGRLVPSPRFALKEDADDWLQKMKRKKNFGKQGLLPELRENEVPTFLEYAQGWLQFRIQEHGANTWKSDERRLRNHVLPVFGQMPINKINDADIRNFLGGLKVEKVAKGGKRTEAKASAGTVKLVKALLSGIFQSALEERPPLVPFNPVKNVRLKGSRKAQGPKIPTRILEDDAACIRFLEAAAATVGFAPHAVVVNGRALAYAALMLMTGCRVSEAMALRWRDVSFRFGTVNFAWIYERESKSLKQRTKKGELESRQVPMPDDLASILKVWKATTLFSRPDDFVLCRSGGGHMSESTVRAMHRRVAKRARTDVPRHGLRHSFAVRFAIQSGNMPALKEILGHSSMATTEIYSKVRAQHLSQFKSVMNLGVNASELNERHHSDTTKTATPGKAK